MTTNWAEWAFENGQITKIRPSDGGGGRTIPMVVKSGYGGYGMVGMVRDDSKVIWEFSVNQAVMIPIHL